ncbi:MAG: 2-phospho-L-lactate transferase CofD family protein [Candidatus Gracilibacteria bacterium]|nr:2-phospho-L-lactate transferase CofD family protein [Candidatus Gracilibacteria bacterium]
MKKVTTIGGGNGQSNLLDGLFTILGDKVEITSIVSMSDDGRTTGELMRAFDEELDLHLPPPGDLRRCLFSLSNSIYREYFKLIFEYTFLNEEKISNFSIIELFKQANKELLFFGKAGVYKTQLEEFEYNRGDLYSFLNSKLKDYFNFVLPLKSRINGHKLGNILMANLYYNLGNDYDEMIKVMHYILEVNSKVIPVTTKKAFIRAVLGNGKIIESQDRISNVANYNSGIADLELMECSMDATHNSEVHESIINSDFIIIGPGDLFTSIISNFIIGGVRESILQSKAKIIYIGNSTNKGGETTGLTQLDFVNKIERFLGRRIDYFVINNKKLELDEEELEQFKNDISVKGGDYLFLSPGEKKELERRKINVIESDLLGKDSFYKHSKDKIVNVLSQIFFA